MAHELAQDEAHLEQEIFRSPLASNSDAHGMFDDMPQSENDAARAKMVEFTAPMGTMSVAHKRWPLTNVVG